MAHSTKKAGDGVARFAQSALVERVDVVGAFGADVDRLGAGSARALGETGRGVNGARASDGHEHVARRQRLDDAIHLERHLAEPADVRSNAPAAWAARDAGRIHVFAGILERSGVVALATAFEELAVHVHDAARTGTLVQGI